MSYKTKPQIHLYEYKNNSFLQTAIIDDYKEVSFEHNLYSAGTFTITINYNIPNALLFKRGMFIQFGSDPYDFGEILSIRDTIGEDGKGSQIRTITGYDARYIFKRRIIKNLNANGMWKMTAKGEVCIRELIKSECGLLAEEKRQLPIKNIPSYLNEFESEPLPVNDCYWGGCYSKEKHLFILTGEQGTILRSRDAFNWEIALNLGGGWFERCFYSDHYQAFFAVGNSAYDSETQVSYIYKSTDGIAWTKVYQSKSFIYLTDICENDNGVLVAVGQYYIVRSTNGTSWNLRNPAYTFKGVYFAKGVFIGLLSDGIAISRTDGVYWQKVNNVQGEFYYASYSLKHDKIVAVGRYIYESFDGENFILAKTPEQYPLRFISWNDEKEMFYACGLKGFAIKSRDGYEWEEINLPIEKTNSTYLTGIFFSEEFRTFIYGGFFLPTASIFLAQKIDAVGKEYSVSEQFTNLYEVCKTIATQSEIGWRVKFDNGNLTLECYSGTDRSNTVQFSTDFDSLRNGEFSDSSESYSNAIYIGGKGQNDERDIYEGEDGTPNGLDRFEAWDDQSQMTTTDEYTAEALSMLSQYGQTVNVSGNGLAKCPYVYKEQYDVGDIITIAFSGKTAKVQILSVTERWAWNQYDISFSFGKPQNNLAEQLQLMLRKIQGASNKEKATESVKWYTIPTATSMPADDVTFNTIGFTGTMTANSTFTLYRDSEGTGAKSYNIYTKNLSGNYNLTLTTGVSGKSNFTIKGGSNIVARILVDEEGNIISQGMTATSVIESGNNQPATSGGVAGAIENALNNPLIKTFSNDVASNKIIHLGHFTIPSIYVNRCGLNIEIEAKRADGSYKILSSIVAQSLKIGVFDASDFINLKFYKTDDNNFDLYLFIGSYIKQVFVKMTEPLNFTYDGSVVSSYTGTKVDPIYSNSVNSVILNNMCPVTSNAVYEYINAGNFTSNGLKQSYQINKTVSEPNVWTNIVTHSDINVSGLYVFRVKINDDAIWWTENISFILYYYAEKTNSNAISPIYFNQSGHSNNNATVELRVQRHGKNSDIPYTSIQIKLSAKITNADTNITIYVYKIA